MQRKKCIILIKTRRSKFNLNKDNQEVKIRSSNFEVKSFVAFYISAFLIKLFTID